MVNGCYLTKQVRIRERLKGPVEAVIILTRVMIASLLYLSAVISLPQA